MPFSVTRAARTCAVRPFSIPFSTTRVAHVRRETVLRPSLATKAGHMHRDIVQDHARHHGRARASQDFSPAGFRARVVGHAGPGGAFLLVSKSTSQTVNIQMITDPSCGERCPPAHAIVAPLLWSMTVDTTPFMFRCIKGCTYLVVFQNMHASWHNRNSRKPKHGRLRGARIPHFLFVLHYITFRLSQLMIDNWHHTFHFFSSSHTHVKSVPNR